MGDTEKVVKYMSWDQEEGWDKWIRSPTCKFKEQKRSGLEPRILPMFRGREEAAYPAKETDGANKVRGEPSMHLSGNRVKKLLPRTGSKPTVSGAL